MVFNSLSFVVFFAAVVGLHRLPFRWRTKKIHLLVASYLFYAAWNPPFVALLWISTVVDWYAAGKFLLLNFSAMAAAVGIHYQVPAADIVLPVGISFYTFATMSYTLDVYLRRAAPARNFLDYALFVTFFPHLVAGPIMRPTELVPQFAEPRRASGHQLCFGLGLMTLGLFEKVVLADSLLARAADLVYGGTKVPGALDAWVSTLAFSGQIFCDFAGYSTTAIGAAMCLGFAMPDNFRFPYAAVGFTDFWRRWHITLSAWLRDYLYIPLGGNRHGRARTMLALMGTMLLGGLWHGASWTFVVWGGLHGLYLSVERLLRSRFGGWQPGPVSLFGLGLLTFAWVNVAWVFFRAATFGGAWLVLSGMFGQNATAVPILATNYLVTVGVTVFALVTVHWLMRERTLESVVARSPVPVLSIAWGLMAFAIVIAQGKGDAFIYFQF